MRIKKLLDSWRGSHLLAKGLLIVSISLSVTCLFLAQLLFSKKQELVFVPPYMETQVVLDSPEYKQAWGLYFANLLGNVTPQNVKFVKQSIGELLDASVYSSVIKILDAQVELIVKQGLATQFRAEAVVYQHSKDMVFVTGTTTAKTAIGQSPETLRTYEFQIRIVGYRPTLYHLRSFAGPPKLLDPQREKQIADRAKRRGIASDDHGAQDFEDPESSEEDQGEADGDAKPELVSQPTPTKQVIE